MLHTQNSAERKANVRNDKGPKPFRISKQLLMDAFKSVKAHRGAAGIDDQSIAEFEVDLQANLAKLWNRMSSGTYFPPPVRAVEIPKKGSGTRTLGIPTVGDRIVQTAVKLALEPKVEPAFHPDSYGYRPKRSAIDAVTVCRLRCWRYDWVVDLDISSFFDSIDHDLVMDLVSRYTQDRWILLLMQRWLTAPMQTADGKLHPRDRGTPQGSAISPLIANIVLHHVFDEWMTAELSFAPFERYADDAVVHVKTKAQASWVKERITERLAEYGFTLHPDKTAIVYCKDKKRKASHDVISFDFLGFTFRPRRSADRNGEVFCNFLPAVSDRAVKDMRAKLRDLRIGWRSDMSLDELAEMINATVDGWINYYAKFYPSQLRRVLGAINRQLSKWARRKYKRLRSPQRAWLWLKRVAQRDPKLFAHWRFGALGLQLS